MCPRKFNIASASDLKADLEKGRQCQIRDQHEPCTQCEYDGRELFGMEAGRQCFRELFQGCYGCTLWSAVLPIPAVNRSEARCKSKRWLTIINGRIGQTTTLSTAGRDQSQSRCRYRFTTGSVMLSPFPKAVTEKLSNHTLEHTTVMYVTANRVRT